MKRIAILAITLMLIGARATLGHADTVLTGSTEGGAFFTIAIPNEWNGELVIWNHGLTLDPPEPGPDLGPLAQVQLSEGYAVAASSYRQIGWALFKTKNDLQNLVDRFKENFGTPNQVFITGASLGGIVTAQAIEKANLGNVVGGYTLCGAQAGSRNWDLGLDLRLIYDVVCQDVPGAFIPGGAEGLPKDSTLTEVEVALAVNACTGHMLPRVMRTDQQQQNFERILNVISGPGPNFPIAEEFFPRLMRNATFTWSDIVHTSTKLAGHLGTGNIGVDYDDDVINDYIERVSPNPGAKNRLTKNYTPTGNVGDTKLVSLHTDKDGRVVVENQSEYALVVPAANLTTAIVVEEVPSHCGFTDAEGVAGWESLRSWVAGDDQPTPASIQETCEQLVEEKLFAGPCRIDPYFIIPGMDTRIRPR